LDWRRATITEKIENDKLHHFMSN